MRFPKVVLTAAALGVLLPAGCYAAGKTVTLVDYDNALAVVQAKVNAATNAVANGDGLTGETPGDFARRTFGGISDVRMADGSLLHVSTKGLALTIASADTVRSDDDQVEAYQAVSRRIEFLRGEVRAEAHLPPLTSTGKSAGAPIPSTKSRAIAREVLSGPAFASDPVPPPSWAEEKMKAFNKWLERTLNKLFQKPVKNTNLPTISPKVMWGFVWILIAGLFALLVWIVAQIIGRRQARAKPLALSSTEEALVEARDKETLLTLAEKHARNGEYRYAFRLVYLAVLIALDTEGVLRFDRSKTNWEYVRALRGTGRQDVYDVLVPLTRDFDRVWYGLATAAAPEVYRRAVDEYEKLTAPPVEKASVAS
jgi:hypothetical protein